MKNNTANVISIFENERVRIVEYDDKNKPFYVGNKRYKGIGSLLNGFLVVHASERFPCFDSSDYLYEDRYYHWFFICASLSDYMKIKKLLKRREITLCSFNAGTEAGAWEKNYGSLGLPVAYCLDDSDRLVVAENV